MLRETLLEGNYFVEEDDRLKAVFHAHLHGPRRTGSGNLAIGNPKRGRGPPAAIEWSSQGVAQVDAVEHIEKLGAEA